MATTTVSDKQAARDARLDALKTATEKWAADKLQKLEDEKEFLQSVLKGRTGAGRLASSKTAKVVAAVATEVESFLT